MRWLLSLILALVLLLAVPANAGGRDRLVWVIGGRYSNVYHPAACSRVRKHRRDAERMWESDARDLGLRNHGCGSH